MKKKEKTKLQVLKKYQQNIQEEQRHDSDDQIQHSQIPPQTIKEKFAKILGLDPQSRNFIQQLQIDYNNISHNQLTELLNQQQIKIEHYQDDLIPEQYVHNLDYLKIQKIENQEQAEKFKLKQTIRREKDGTIIKGLSKKEEKQIEVYSRLKQWSSGMLQYNKKYQNKQQINQKQQHQVFNQNYFEDPLRIMQAMQKQKQIKKNTEEEDQLPKCKFMGRGNRFGILPGYRWDGAERGNGFQKKLIEHRNNLKGKQQNQMKDYLKNL